MKYIKASMLKVIAVAVLCSAGAACSQNQPNSTDMNNTVKTDKSEIHSDFYNFKMNLLDGTEVDFSKLKGKKVLLVNVASECGYTPQYKELQQLHEQYKDQVQVLGFPANNFGGQEPGSHEEIAEFCEKNYGVTFPVFEKISVKGDDQHPLYKWLSEQAKQEPTWNFNKYLLDENGHLVRYYPSKVSPMSEELLQDIQK